MNWILRSTRKAMVVTVSAAVAASFSLAGCADSGSGKSPGSTSSSGVGSDKAAGASIVKQAPVAKASDIPAGSAMAKIKKAGVLKVGGTATSPLFSLKNPVSGKYTGFDAVLAKMLAKYITGKAKVERRQITVATREAVLKNHTVDVVIATYTITPERAKQVNFAGPYFSDGDTILVRKDTNDIKNVKDLEGKKICTETASSAVGTLKQKLKNPKLLLLDTNDECLQALEQERADAYVLDGSIVGGDAKQNPDKVKVVGKSFSTEPYGIGLAKDRPEMQKFVNDWLNKIEKDGLWKKVWDATLKDSLSGEAPKPPKITTGK